MFILIIKCIHRNNKIQCNSWTYVSFIHYSFYEFMNTHECTYTHTSPEIFFISLVLLTIFTLLFVYFSALPFCVYVFFSFYHNTYTFCLHTGHISLFHFIIHPVWKQCLHTKYVGFESSLLVNNIRQIEQTSCTYVFIVTSRNSGIEGTALLCGCACLCCLATNGGMLLTRPLSISRW